MSVTIPFTFTGGAGNKARASEVNSNFQSIASKFTEGSGGISDGDIATTAGIKAAKLSAVPGNRITQAQMDDDAVDARVLHDDTGPGAANAAVNNANHIKDAIITNAKLVDGTIKKGKLNLQSVVVSVPGHVRGFQFVVSTGLNSASAFPIGFHVENGPTALTVVMKLYLTTATGAYDLVCVSSEADSATTNVRIWYFQVT